MVYSKKDIIEEIQRVGEIISDEPIGRDIEKYSDVSLSTMGRAFGDWSTAKKKAGFGEYEYGIGENKLLEEIRNISEKKEKVSSPPTKSEMDEHGKYSSTVYEINFDSWNEAIEKAGYESHQAGTRSWNEIPKKDIFSDIERIIKEECGGEFPSMEEYMEYTNYSRSMLQRRFGGLWNVSIEMGYRDKGEKWYPTGEDHYAWTGGYEYYYGPSWVKQKRKAIRRADGCEVCGSKRTYMDVHHISPKKFWKIDKEHEKMNNLRNLIYLCRSCHRQLEGKFKGRNYEEFKRLARDFLDMDEEPPVNDSSVFDY